MKLVIGLVVLLLLASIALSLLRKKRAVVASEWPVFANPLLSHIERTVYERLSRAFPDVTVFSQVAVSQFIGVKDRARNQGVFNRFSQLAADFVLCGKDSRVLAVIELDDRSHDSPRRMAADARKAAVLKSAGIELIRINVNPVPTEETLRQQIRLQPN